MSYEVEEYIFQTLGEGLFHHIWTRRMNLNNRPIWFFPVIAAGLAAVLGGVLIISLSSTPEAGGYDHAAPVRVSGEAQIGGPFTLVDHTGAVVTQADYKGKAMLIYFGFAYCPDICPTSLQVMAEALDQLTEEQRVQFQPLLISVDPERDTPQSLARYVDSPVFPANLIGLTGSEEQVRQVASAYRVYYRRFEDEDTLAAYTMDHSSLIYLMGRDGRFLEVFSPQATPAELASGFQRFLEENPEQS